MDWDAVAGILAAVMVLVMHFLHVVDEEVLLVISPVLIALLFIRDLRRENYREALENSVKRSEQALNDIKNGLRIPDTILIGPGELREQSARFSRNAEGEMLWFHVCLLMFRTQELFDVLLKPALENPKVKSLIFVLDEKQKPLWTTEIVPKLAACGSGHKVLEPRWTQITENVSFILAGAQGTGKSECLLSFWGEPFMASVVGKNVPRYIFHVQGHSELVNRLAELGRTYRLK